MKTRFLLSHRFKRIGWLITLPAILLMLLNLHYEFSFSFLDYAQKGVKHISFDKGWLFTIQFNNFIDEVGGILLVSGLLLIAFSKEKQEDEHIQQLRLESLLWAVFINAVLLVLAIIFLYNGLFLSAMAYNICTPLILFIARFNLLLYFERKGLKKEGA